MYFQYSRAYNPECGIPRAESRKVAERLKLRIRVTEVVLKS
jgi:hypothetical protein